MQVTMLNGLGCLQCGGNCSQVSGFGAVSDYDKITVGGKTYTVNQIIGKTVIAGRDTKIYSGVKGNPTVLGTVKAGEQIGIVYSYLRPDQANGKSWLMFDSSLGKIFYVPNEAVSDTGLKDQGTLTVKQEVKAEEIEKLKEDSPIEYYVSKYATKGILIIGGIILAVSLGKELIRHQSKSKTAVTE